jgi:hypothetical protein
VTARSVGVLGEGESGFYDADEPTPENTQARADAAADADIAPPPQAPPPPDVHALARQIDPDTFEQYDGFAAEREAQRARVAQLGAEREASPEAVAAQGQIDTILGRVNNVESRLTNAARARLAAAQETLDGILHTDSPEMAAARDALLQADYAMRDLAPEVSTAYRQAREIAPNLPETAEGAGGEAAPEARAAEAAGTGREAQAEVAPPSVTGEEKLGEGALATVRPDAPEATGPEVVGAERSAQEGAEGAPAPQPLSQARYGNLRAVEGTGETVERGLSKGVEEGAIEKGITDNFGDLPEYQRLSMADQARQAAELIGRDYEGAKDVAMGLRQPPKGLLPESVFVGVEKRAIAEGDVETLRQLATQSRLNIAATTMGQRIRTLGERDASSPVGAIQDIQRARETEFTRKGADLEAAKRATVTEIRTEMRKAASKKPVWEEFLSNLRCGE